MLGRVLEVGVVVLRRQSINGPAHLLLFTMKESVISPCLSPTAALEHLTGPTLYPPPNAYGAPPVPLCFGGGELGRGARTRSSSRSEVENRKVEVSDGALSLESRTQKRC